MKKLFFYPTLILLMVTSFLTAQEFNKGTNVINAGIGIGGNFNYGSFGTSSQGLGLNASYERGIWEIGGPGVISLGGYFGTKTYKYDYFGGNEKWTYTIVGVRGAYHYNGLEVENLDVYGGAMLSYNLVSYDGNSGSLNSRPSGTVFVGGRWFFSENFAVFAEGGYGVAFLSLGISLRF